MLEKIVGKSGFEGWFKKGGFKNNFLFTSSSKVFAIGLTFIFTPVFSRIYDPEAYGYFSVLNILITHFGVLSTFGYSEAIQIAREEGEVKSLSVLSITSIFFTLGCFILLFPWIMGDLLNTSLVGHSLLIQVTFVVVPAIMALIDVFNKWSQYYNEFRFATVQNSVITLLIRLIGMGFAFIGNGFVFGLVYAEGMGRSGAALSYSVRYKQMLKGLLSHFTIVDLKYVLLKYKDYPRFLLSSRYLGLALSQIPLLFIANHYSTGILGQMSMAMSLVTYPLALLGNSMAPVFLRRIRDSNESDLRQMIGRLNTLLSTLCIGPVIVAMVFAQDIWLFFLGNSWELSGMIASVLVITLIHDMLCIIFGGVYQLRGIQKGLLQINLAAVVVCIFLYAYMQKNSVGIMFVVSAFSIVRLFSSMAKCSFLFAKLRMFKGLFFNMGLGFLLVLVLFYLGGPM